jgi:uncharacterized protein (TIGR02996 family)
MKWITLVMVLITALPAAANELHSELLEIQHRWAQIQYQLEEDKREEAFETLAGQAGELVSAYPERAEPLIWEGIVLSTWAGAKGGFGALGLVKDARKSLEKALEIDPTALEGSAYTSLGSLYYQVPGWPLGYGDDNKAKELLLQALELNPDGMDPNYFYADFLMEQGEDNRAQPYLQRVLSAPARPERPVADAGRREEAKAKLMALED